MSNNNNYPGIQQVTAATSLLQLPLSHRQHLLGSSLPVDHLGSGKDVDRLLQWSHLEIRDLIAIRGELERDFTQTKRNKTLWEFISAKMKDRGHRRSADQCKCKWKNLVNRYKMTAVDKDQSTTSGQTGEHTSDARQSCPFFDEMHAIFTTRAKTTPKNPLALESDLQVLATSKKRGRPKEDVRSSEEIMTEEELEEEHDLEASHEGVDMASTKAKKIGVRPVHHQNNVRVSSIAERGRTLRMQEMLEDFFEQQQCLELQWAQTMKRREEDRHAREQAFFASMEKLETERLRRQQHWLEVEERRRAREDARADKRDALFSLLLARLTRGQDIQL